MVLDAPRESIQFLSQSSSWLVQPSEAKAGPRCGFAGFGGVGQPRGNDSSKRDGTAAARVVEGVKKGVRCGQRGAGPVREARVVRVRVVVATGPRGAVQGGAVRCGWRCG